jgi:hypothetical protein
MSDNEKCQRCCCGKYSDIDETGFIHNNIQHMPIGSFCGPVDHHTIKALQDKIAELEADKERLDWFDSVDESFVEIVRMYDMGGVRYCGVRLCTKQLFPATKGRDVREAIDKARK